MHAPRPHAFTLIELLVVVAVIALLGSLVLSASFRAMDMAKQAQCRSNMNQIGKAFFLYLHRYDQWMVAIGTPPGHYTGWYIALADEVGAPKITKCPTKPQTALGYGYNVRYADPFGNKHCSLALSSLYGSYKVLSEYEIPQDQIVNMFCPHCHAELIGGGMCAECGAPMVPMIVRGGGVVQICSRRGCRGHMLDVGGTVLE